MINWLDVDKDPLVVFDEEGNWEATKLGTETSEFLIAVPTNTDEGWWIARCILEDEVGLVEIMDGCTQGCGYDLKDVAFWKPIDHTELNKLYKPKLEGYLNWKNNG